MAIERKDLVQDTASSTGTGAFVMTGTPAAGFQAFSVHTNGATFDYKAAAGAQWEVGVGTWNGTSIARSPTASSNGNALVNFTVAPTVMEVVSANSVSSMVMSNDVPFAQTIPLTTRGETYMPLQRIATTGPLTFTPAANAVRGAYNFVTVVGDGSTALTVSGFNEDSGSFGFTNVANMPYDFVFWYTGYEYRYTVQQALSPVAILAAPTAVQLSLSSASTVVGSPVTVTVSMNGALTGAQTETITLTAPVTGTWSPSNVVTLTSTTATSAATFTPSAAGSGNITASASGTPTLTGASKAYAATSAPVQAITVNNPGTQTVSTPFNVTGTYANGTPTALDYRLSDDTAGVWTPAPGTPTISGGNFSFSLTPSTPSAGRTISVRDRTTQVFGTSGTYVVNAAAAASPYPQLTSLSKLAQSGSGPFTYTGDGTGDLNSANGGITTKTLAASTDGSMDFVITNDPSEVIIGFSITSALQTYGNLRFCLYAPGSAGTSAPASYRKIAIGQGNAANAAGLPVAAGDILRIKRVGTLLKSYVARAADPTNFLQLDSFDHTTAPQMWIQVIATSTSAVQLTAWSGFA